MKSRLAILTMLVLGMLLSTAGAGLAVSGLSGDNASIAQYSTPTPTPTGGGGVLGDQDTGNGNAPRRTTAAATPAAAADVQPARQVEAGANNSKLPFTGFAAIPVLLGGLALLSARPRAAPPHRRRALSAAHTERLTRGGLRPASRVNSNGIGEPAAPARRRGGAAASSPPRELLGQRLERVEPQRLRRLRPRVLARPAPATIAWP